MWLALRFIDWPLDCRADADATPALVIAPASGRQRVVATCPRARVAGVEPGMDLADARLRLDTVRIHARSPAAEAAAMARLAGWAWGYSNQLHCATADVECARLVLEIGASLRLFGGRQALLRRIRHDLDGFGHRYRAGLGATPQAALARARADPPADRGLAGLPVTCLDLDPATTATLTASGIRYTGELLALPPATLRRRFGDSPLAALERLRGRRPHGLDLYRLPARYRTRHELGSPVSHVQGLMFILRRVFVELAAFLNGSGCAIQSLRVSLGHERQPATRLDLRLSAPSAAAGHLERLVRERLDRTTLVAPVREIGLASDRLRPCEGRQASLWGGVGATATDPWPALLDRLRARLGHDAVRWVGHTVDHRPTRASNLQAAPPRPPPSSGGDDPPPRPLWLLEPPQPLSATLTARLTWVSGPERIESGWWEADQRRDYYRAMDDNGRLLWVFRDLHVHPAPVYYLHGLFA